MILDAENLFSDDQAVTVTAVSTNIIDLGADDAYIQDLNEKGVIELLAQVTADFTAAGAATMRVALQEDDDSAFGSAVTVMETEDIGKAELIAGYQFRFSTLPRISKRYLRLNYTVTTGPMTAGNIVAGLILDRHTNGI